MKSEIVGRAEERRVIVASSLGTVFEWYDFYLYATLAPHLAARFFPPGNETAALLSAFAVYALGFVARPFGAVVFARVGGGVGLRRTFLATLLIIGLATFLVGALPGYESVGLLAPILLVALRLLHGLALGGESSGAATYVAEHVANHRRGYATSWIRTTATVGFLLSLLVTALLRWQMDAAAFAEWGWRVPFWASLVVLAFSLHVRLRLGDSPFRFIAGARRSPERAPKKLVLLALLGATAGQGVVWYTGQFYVLVFLQVTLRVDSLLASILVGVALLLATPGFVLFGKLSDHIGRLKIILAGCLLAALTYIPLFKGLTHYVNPALEAFTARTPIVVAAADCELRVFVVSPAGSSACDRARDYLTRKGLSFEARPAAEGQPIQVTIGDTVISGWGEREVQLADAALAARGYPMAGASADDIDVPMTLLILFVLVLYVTMVYGPITAFLVELFPARVRYTSLPIPYHIGNGWFGGMLPLLATAMVASAGDIYSGLTYPITVAVITLVVGAVFLREKPASFDIRA